MQINGKKLTAIVAGGSAGIGFAIAKYLASKNYTLLLLARDKENLEKQTHVLEGKHYCTALDIVNYESLKNAVDSFLT
jgi:NADP-dependent 3-hydroxy acid dehydrogenase YdfG